MPGIRTLEIGYPDSLSTYATPESAERSLKKWTDRIKGCVNARIVPVENRTMEDAGKRLRYGIILSCFSEESDIFLLARSRCPFLIHR